jgi:hypothetical protein
MKKQLWVLLLIGLCGGLLPAQNTMSFDDYMQLLRNDFSTMKKDIVAKNMTFAEGEAAKFWPLYRDYERDTQALNDKVIAVVKEYAEHYNKQTVSDAYAQELYTRNLTLDKERIALREKYFKKFTEVLPAKLVVRFFQIDQKLQAAIAFKIADEIPVVE